MMATNDTYTTQLQAGLGMVAETLALLRVWEPGMLPSRLAERAVEVGVFSRATARRTRNLATEMFAPRYLTSNGLAAERLQCLVAHQAPPEAISQICFLYTARAQRIFAEFVTDVFWPRYHANAGSLSRKEAEAFVRFAMDSGRMTKRWAESTVKRVSGYLIGCCTDFGLLADANRSDRIIQRFRLRPDVAVYLAYDLHFAGLGSQAVVHSNDWRLFGLDIQEVIGVLKGVAQDGHLLVQSSGELVDIAWKYPSMKECLHAIAQG
jgi:hypothetical protein